MEKVTIQSKLLELLPNAPIVNETLIICPLLVDKNFRCNAVLRDECQNCRRKYWMKKIY